MLKDLSKKTVNDRKLHDMDTTDKKIIRLLQQNARMTHKNIGLNIRLPTSTVSDRIRALSSAGIIKNTVVQIDPSSVNLSTLAYISVLIDWMETTKDFGIAVQSIPEVMECHRITGDWSYLLKVRARDNIQLEELISNKIKAFPGVTRSETIFVLKTDKETMELALDLTE